MVVEPLIHQSYCSNMKYPIYQRLNVKKGLNKKMFYRLVIMHFRVLSKQSEHKQDVQHFLIFGVIIFYKHLFYNLFLVSVEPIKPA